MFETNELIDLSHTIAAPLFEGKQYPWEVLPLIKDFILKIGPTLDPEVYEQSDTCFKIRYREDPAGCKRDHDRSSPRKNG